MDHIQQFKAAVPGQDFTLNPDGSLDYELTIFPVRFSALSQGRGFANAILGPSHSSRPPSYTLAGGTTVSADEIEDLRALVETCTA